jgi:RIO kinase 1
VIDVSQAVEHEHPHALEFLRKDCANVTEYFRKKEVSVMSVKELFDFVTDPSIASGDVQPYLEKMQEITASRVAEKPTAEEQVEEQVFQQAFIPKRLDEVNSLKTSLALYI